MLELDFAIGTTARSNALTLHRASWPKLAAWLTKHQPRAEKDGRVIVFAQLSEPVRRASNVRAVTAAALDVDGKETAPPPADEAISRLKALGSAAALWTTHSHHRDAPRYRVVIPLAAPMAPAALQIALQATAQALGLSDATDAVCHDAARCFYIASCPRDAMPMAAGWFTDGPPLSIEPFMAAADAVARRAKARQMQFAARPRANGGALLERAAQAIGMAGDGARNATANRWGYIVGRAAAAGEIDGHQAEQVLLAAACAAGLSSHEAGYCLRRAMRQAGAQ